MSSASAGAGRRLAPAASSGACAGDLRRRAGTEIMSVMLTYLAPIVSAGKTFYRPACLFVSQFAPRKGLQIGQVLPAMGPQPEHVGEGSGLGTQVRGEPEAWPRQPPITIATASSGTTASWCRGARRACTC